MRARPRRARTRSAARLAKAAFFEPGLQVVILIGLQGSGKTTFYRRHLAATHALVSRDLFRHNRKPSRRQAELLEAALHEGKPVVVDNTNATLAQRKAIIEIAQRRRAKVIGCFFESPVKDCVRRNAQRTGRERVPDVAIYVTAAKLVAPVYAEGFDHLYHVRLDQRGGFIVDDWRDSKARSA